MNRPDSNDMVETMREILFIISSTMICAGCGPENGKDVPPVQAACAAGQNLFTYPTSLPPNQISVAEFALDEANIYFTGYSNDGQIMRVPIEGGEPVPVATGENFPLHITLDAQNIYWTTQAEIRKIPLAGGPPVTLASSIGTPQSIAVDAHYVYWTTSLARLARVSIDSGAVTELLDDSATSIGFTGIALDATNIYWGSRGELGPNKGFVAKMPIDGGPVTTLAMGQSEPSRIAVDAQNVYWTNVGPFNENVGLMTIPIDGGVLIPLIPTQSPTYAKYAAVAGFFVDEQNVYWTSRGTQEYDHYDGTVMKMSLVDEIPETLASAVRKAQETLIVRDCAVYFAANGQINRIGAPL